MTKLLASINRRRYLLLTTIIVAIALVISIGLSLLSSLGSASIIIGIVTSSISVFAISIFVEAALGIVEYKRLKHAFGLAGESLWLLIVPVVVHATPHTLAYFGISNFYLANIPFLILFMFLALKKG